MSLKNKLRVFAVLVILFIAFLVREEFNEGIAFDNVKHVSTTKDNVEIFVATDIHYLSNKINDKGDAFQKYLTNGDSKQLDYIEEITDAFIDEVEEEKPKFLIISGDLTNNGERESHQDLIEKLNYIESIGTEIYVIPGNHDIANPWSSGFKEDKQYEVNSISKDEFKSLYHEFGYSDAISYDRDTLSYLVPATSRLWFLMLDTNMYLENDGRTAPEEQGQVTLETFEWIKAAAKLAKENNAQVITVMHHNLLDHSSTINKGFTLDYNDKAIKKFRDFGLDIVLSGHIHIQDIASDISSNNNSIYDIATGALSVYPQKYGILEYNNSNNELHYKTSEIDMDSWARKKGDGDENLLDFTNYSRNFFDEKSLVMATNYANTVSNCVKDEKAEMIETLKKLSERVFLGEDNIKNNEILSSTGYKLWLEKGSDSQKEYLNSLTENNDINDNEIKIIIED